MAIKTRQENPEIYEAFCYLADELRRRDVTKYSAGGILSYMRYETTLREEPFKINGNVAAFFARWYMDERPDAEGFFRTRVQKSKYVMPSELPELGPDNYIETEDTLKYAGGAE